MAIKSVLGGDFSLGERTDEQLVDLARTGGSRTGAWDELYRRHAHPARSVARHLLRSRHDADDVVNEAFAGVIAAIGNGAGPRDNFRQYLMACVRNGCKKRAWRGNTTISTDPTVLETRHGAVFEDAEQFGEAGVVASAFSSLSTDWQRALWLTAVEQRPTEDIARELGRRPAAVAALAHRAREAFAEAYLAQHQQRVTSPACERVTPKLAHYVRGRAGDIDTARVEHHLSACGECTRAVAELRDVNSSLRTLALPASLAGAGLVAAVGAPAVGFGAWATLGGWSATTVGGATLAKAAVLAALLVPAALIANEAARQPQQSITVGQPVTAGESFGAQDLPDAHFEPTADSRATTSPDEVPTSSTSIVSANTIEAPATASATSDPGATDPAAAGQPAAAGAAAVAPVVAIGNPGGTPRRVVPSNPADVSVPASTATLPISTPLSIPAITLPGVSTPEITTPEITTPEITTPEITTPEITTPEITTPAVSIPSISLPLVTTPPVDVPSLTIPSLTIPSLTVPAVTVPSVTVPPLALTPPISVPEITLVEIVVPVVVPVVEPLTADAS